MAETFDGIPIHRADMLKPGQVVRYRGRIHAHPTVLYQWQIAAAEDLPMSDLWPMEVASLIWQVERIEAAAQQAERRLDQLMRHQDLQRALRMDADAKRAELHDRMLDWHPGVEHTWTRNLLQLTVTCQECAGVATYEQMHRMGVPIPDVWRAVEEWPRRAGKTARAWMAREDGAR